MAIRQELSDDKLNPFLLHVDNIHKEAIAKHFVTGNHQVNHYFLWKNYWRCIASFTLLFQLFLMFKDIAQSMNAIGTVMIVIFARNNFLLYLAFLLCAAITTKLILHIGH